MRQQFTSVWMLSTAIAITYFSLSLTGCTTPDADTAPSNGGAPTSGSADTAPFDVHVPATFDPKDPNFKLFDPCTELDDEVFKKAGLGKRSRITNGPNADYKLCGFQTAPESRYFGSVSVVMNRVDLETVARNRYLISAEVESSIPGLYFYRLDSESVHECSTVAQTEQGQFEIMLVDEDKVLSPSEVCDESLAILEVLYPEVEKRIKDGLR